MPELPEVETMCRGISAVVGRTIERVFRPRCRFRPISIRPPAADINKRLSGLTVLEVTRLGKRVLIHAGDYVLILQPKMSGLVSLDQLPDREHVRLQLQFTGEPALRVLFWDRRGLGTVELLREDEIQARIIDGRLGPDALAIGFEDFAARLRATDRPIKVALLDQKLTAGIGNLYASEMLHEARIYPAAPSSSLSKRKLQVLYDQMRRILLDAIAAEGSTLADGTYRTALNDPGNYQNNHRVYDRANLPCLTCGKATITRIVQAQRSTFYCPRCQRS